MAVSISSSLSLGNSDPDFTRQQYATLADMKNVNENKLPQLYIAYCLEDNAGYLFDKGNEVDPVTGKWRKCVVQNFATTMPVPSSKYAGFFVQYTGETTQDYTKGYFYGLTTGTGDITTVSAMKILIDGQSTTVTLDYYGEISVVKCFENSGTDYFVYENVIYSGVPDAGTIEFDPEEATSYETDEAIAALGIVGTVYGWENVPIGPGGSADDKLTWGTALPASGMEDGDPFLYMGPDANIYEEVSGLTPMDNPEELGLFESDGSGGYELSTDTVADVKRFAYYNGSLVAYVLKETPEVGDMVYSMMLGSPAEELGAITEYDASQGIKFGTYDYFFGSYSGMDEPGKTYYALKTITAGTIFQYDENAGAWVPKTAAGEVESIPVADVEAMFD